MKRLYEDYLGFYIPAFFFMEINTEEELFDLNKVSEETLATFHHEYVHFLQDITTSYGLMNISHVVDIQKTINKKILSNSSNRFKLPVVIDNDDVAGINLDLLSLYYGDTELMCRTFQKIKSIDLEENGLIPNFESVPSVVVKVLKGNQEFEFSFGAACILESMAYLIEDLLFDNITPPQFPYKTAEIICDFIYPELIAKNKLNLVYLCDAALNSYHPGQFFYDILHLMKNKKFMPENAKEFYEFLNNYKFYNLNKDEYDIKSLFEHTSITAENQLSDYFTIKYFDSISEWSKDIISTSRNIRLNNFSFWASILEKENKSLRRNEFTKIVLSLGFPLMTNKKDQYFFYHPRIDTENKVIALKAINEIKNILNGKQKGCKMISFCKHSPEGDITSKECFEVPWRNVHKEKLCPFAQIWKMWGLSDKEPEL